MAAGRVEEDGNAHLLLDPNSKSDQDVRFQVVSNDEMRSSSDGHAAGLSRRVSPPSKWAVGVRPARKAPP